MDKKAIETLSVNAVRDSIVQCALLDQFIPDNDKEPSWDGHVYAYKNSSKRKDAFLGRIPVQVKGTEKGDLSKSKISFPVSIIDLHNYLNDGGVLFFVVYIGSTEARRQIYYTDLTPIKIRMILKKKKGEKTKNIHLKCFPQDEDERTSIVLNCIEQCKKQTSFKTAPLPTLDELCKTGAIERFEIPIATTGKTDPERFLFSNDVYVYVKLKNSAISQPLEFIPKNIVATEIQTACITVGEKLFYDKIKIQQDGRFVKTTFGQSFLLIADKEERTIRVEYKNSDSLRNLVVDLDFMLSYISEGCFSYNGTPFPFDNKGANLSNFAIEDEKQRLLYAKKFVSLLDGLGCKKDVSISKMSDADWYKANLLIKALVDKETITEIPENLPAVFFASIENLRFMLYYKIASEKPRTYALFDFFRNEVEVECLNRNGERVPISQYANLDAETLLHTDNLYLDAILPSFQKLTRHDETIARANFVLLELLGAYDRSGNPEFLNTAEEFSAWIMTASEQELQYDIRLLNDLQIKKRRRDLTAEEETELVQITEDRDVLEQIKVGAYLLLNQQTAARIHFERLKPNEQEEFRKYPICRFCENF